MQSWCPAPAGPTSQRPVFLVSGTRSTDPARECARRAPAPSDCRRGPPDRPRPAPARRRARRRARVAGARGPARHGGGRRHRAAAPGAPARAGGHGHRQVARLPRPRPRERASGGRRDRHQGPAGAAGRQGPAAAGRRARAGRSGARPCSRWPRAAATTCACSRCTAARVPSPSRRACSRARPRAWRRRCCGCGPGRTRPSTGDRDEVPFPVTDRAWQQVSVSARDCLGRRCPDLVDCFAEKAREAAEEADVVVANHALLALHVFTGVSVLPEHDAVVLDEAHEFVASATEALTAELGRADLRRAAAASADLLPVAVRERMQDAADALEGLLSLLEPGWVRRLPDDALDVLALVESVFGAAGADVGREAGEPDEDGKAQRERARQALADVAGAARRAARPGRRQRRLRGGRARGAAAAGLAAVGGRRPGVPAVRREHGRGDLGHAHARRRLRPHRPLARAAPGRRRPGRAAVRAVRGRGAAAALALARRRQPLRLPAAGAAVGGLRPARARLAGLGAAPSTRCSCSSSRPRAGAPWACSAPPPRRTGPRRPSGRRCPGCRCCCRARTPPARSPTASPPTRAPACSAPGRSGRASTRRVAPASSSSSTASRSPTSTTRSCRPAWRRPGPPASAPSRSRRLPCCSPRAPAGWCARPATAASSPCSTRGWPRPPTRRCCSRPCRGFYRARSREAVLASLRAIDAGAPPVLPVGPPPAQRRAAAARRARA